MIEDIRSKLLGYGLRLELNRLDATLLVVPNPAEPGERNKLAAMLHSGFLVSCSCVMSGHGLFLKYKLGVTVEREIFISRQFSDQHPLVASAITHACAWPESRWKLLHDRDAAVARFASVGAAAKLRIVALATSLEGRAGLPRQMRVVNKTLLISSLDKLSSGHSGGGRL